MSNIISRAGGTGALGQLGLLVNDKKRLRDICNGEQNKKG